MENVFKIGLTVFPEVLHKLARRVAEQCCDVVIQGVHVLRQPGSGIVVHLQSQWHTSVDKYTSNII